MLDTTNIMSNDDQTVAITPAIEKILSSCTSLHSLPSAVVKIIDASKDPEIGIDEVADITRIDPALSATILKLANSHMSSIHR